MRTLLTALPALILLSACQPISLLDTEKTSPSTSKRTPPTSITTKQITKVSPKTQSIPTIPIIHTLPAPPTKAKLTRKTISGIQFEGASYDSRTHKLTVIDQPKGPGTTYATSQQVATKNKALLAINAGFFTPEGTPLGLVISNKKTTGHWNSTSSLGTGIYHQPTTGNPRISRRTSASALSSSSQLLQAGPLLIENRKPVPGLSTKKTAVRSIILTDGTTRWWIGKTSSCTLSVLANALASNSPAPWQPKTALNLDGGRSTDLYISSAISGGPINRRSIFNRPVRNFFILKKK